MGDAHVGLQARLMSQALRKLAGAINRSRCVVVFTNQLRHKIGVMFGSPETTSGGMALKFYASLRLDVRRIEAIKSKTDIVGNRTRIRVKKNKVAPPFKEAQFDIMYNEGISRAGDILDMGVTHDIVDKRGSYFFYADERLGPGRDRARDLNHGPVRRGAPPARSPAGARQWPGNRRHRCPGRHHGVNRQEIGPGQRKEQGRPPWQPGRQPRVPGEGGDHREDKGLVSCPHPAARSPASWSKAGGGIGPTSSSTAASPSA